MNTITRSFTYLRPGYHKLRDTAAIYFLRQYIGAQSALYLSAGGSRKGRARICRQYIDAEKKTGVAKNLKSLPH